MDAMNDSLGLAFPPGTLLSGAMFGSSIDAVVEGNEQDFRPPNGAHSGEVS
jgi:hypothetical protein